MVRLGGQLGVPAVGERRAEPVPQLEVVRARLQRGLEAVARLLVAGGDLGWLEVGADHPFAGAGFFGFGNHRSVAGSVFGTDGCHEVALVAVAVFGFGAQAGQAALRAAGGHFFNLGGADFFQDVGHVRVDFLLCT